MQLAYDSDRHVVYLYGGDYCVFEPALGSDRCSSHEEVWRYDAARDQWALLLDQRAAMQPGWPKGSCQPSFAYDSKRKVIWMTAGDYRGDMYPPMLVEGGLWSFDPETRVWSQQGPSPISESAHVSTLDMRYMDYDPFNDALLGLAQYNSASAAFVYSLAGVAGMDGVQRDNWAAIPLPFRDATPGTQDIFTIDTKRKRAIIYNPYVGETWSLDLTTRQVTKLSSQMITPVDQFGIVYDSANDLVVLFGGSQYFEGASPNPRYNDLWIFDFRSNKWSKKILAGTPPSGRKGNSIAYDAFNNVLVIWGGDPDDTTNNVYLLRLSRGKAP